MMLRKGFSTAAVFALCFLPGIALAQKAADQSGSDNADAQKLRLTLSVKVWANRWSTWNNPQEAETASTKAAFIPAIGLNYGNFFASFGYFGRAGYTFPTLGDTPRSEYDLNLGYWLLQSDTGRLGATIGYKYIKQSFQDTPETIKAPTVGLVGSAHISGRWSLYGSAAIGRATETSPNSFDAAGAILPGVPFKMSGYYTSVETGVAYSVASSTAITAGYRAQVIDVGGPQCDVSGIGNRCRDNTDGFIVGISHTF